MLAGKLELGKREQTLCPWWVGVVGISEVERLESKLCLWLFLRLSWRCVAESRW